MFRALWVDTADAADAVDAAASPVTAEVIDRAETDLMPGDVSIDVEYSSVNYKDALAIAGRPGVIKRHPLIPGIDLVGTVTQSDSPLYRPGDRVILNGWGVGETHHGGLAERARVRAEWLVPLPAGLTGLQAAAIGTAGLTAMLAVLALERAGAIPSARLDDHNYSPGVRSDRDDEPRPGGDQGSFRPAAGGTGEVLVTGAAGGVGGIAVAILSRLGHRVVASTGRPAEADYLRKLGASEILDRAELSEPGRPLQTQRWAAAVDSVGGHTLANVLAQTVYGGTVASCGLAASAELPATVMPFILRGVTLTGINSVQAPFALRSEAWDRLTTDLDPGRLERLTTVVPLTAVAGVAGDILAGRVRGRTVVDVRA